MCEAIVGSKKYMIEMVVSLSLTEKLHLQLIFKALLSMYNVLGKSIYQFLVTIRASASKNNDTLSHLPFYQINVIISHKFVHVDCLSRVIVRIKTCENDCTNVPLRMEHQSVSHRFLQQNSKF